MKTTRLADKVLVHLVKHYKATKGSAYTTFDIVTEHFTDIEEYQLADAVRLLSADGFLQIIGYDDKPGTIIINISALRQTEENTFIKKGYAVFREIMSFIR